jgi:hypothetical protein
MQLLGCVIEAHEIPRKKPKSHFFHFFSFSYFLSFLSLFFRYVILEVGKGVKNGFLAFFGLNHGGIGYLTSASWS